MSDSKPGIQIDDDWKRQAQEEKRKLAEAEAKKREQAAAPAPAPNTSAAAPVRDVPPASFATLVQSLLTQALYYMGEIAAEGQEPIMSLDMSKQQIDLLDILHQKTKGNLTPQEQTLIDTMLYEARTRWVSLASQMIR